MANRNTKGLRAANRKAGQFFHGTHCFTDFAHKSRNPQNRRKSAWRGCPWANAMRE
jgi:hypothetical protein